MTNKKKSKTKKRKLIAALAIGMLALSGGALAAPSSGDLVNAQPLRIGSIKPIIQKPGDFVKMNNLAIAKNFDYFEELNREFREKTFSISPEPISNSVDEGAVIDAINASDYDAWRSAIANLEGIPNDTEQLSEEEFNTLAELHKQRNEFEKNL